MGEFKTQTKGKIAEGQKLAKNPNTVGREKTEQHSGRPVKKKNKDSEQPPPRNGELEKKQVETFRQLHAGGKKAGKTWTSIKRRSPCV